MVEVRKVWQISPPAAMMDSVAEFCLRHSVALLWPGDSGPYAPDRYLGNFAECDWVRWFAETVSAGDAILLRIGPTAIRAVGLVGSEYSYEDRFDDVCGFDLQHCRRVRWFRLPEDYDLGAGAFTRGRFSAVRSSAVRDYVCRFLGSPPTDWQTAMLPELPPEEPPLDAVPQELQGIVSQALDLASLYSDRQSFGEPPSEDELVAHFVVPFLRASGWPPECIAVKWRWIDAAVFASLPRTPENCVLVVEAKRLGAGVEGALEQAKGYVQSLGVPCNVVVTDGFRYRMFSCEDGFAPVAYANLSRLKQPAVELFRRMTKPWRRGTGWNLGINPLRPVRRSAKDARSTRTSSPLRSNRSWRGQLQKTTATPTNSWTERS